MEKWLRLDWRGVCEFKVEGRDNLLSVLKTFDQHALARSLGRLHPEVAASLWKGEVHVPILEVWPRFRLFALGGMAVSAPERFRALGVSEMELASVSSGFHLALEDVATANPAEAAELWSSWNGKQKDKDAEPSNPMERAMKRAMELARAGLNASEEEKALRAIAKAWAKEDFQAAREWMGQLKGEETRQAAWSEYFQARTETVGFTAWQEMRQFLAENPHLSLHSKPNSNPGTKDWGSVLMSALANGLPEAPVDVAQQLAAMDFSTLGAGGQDGMVWQRELMLRWMKHRDSSQAALFLQEAQHLPQAAGLRPAVEAALGAVLKEDTNRGLQLWQQLPKEWQGLDVTAVLEQARPHSSQELETLLEVMQPSQLGVKFVHAASLVDPNRMANWVSQYSSGEDRSGLLHTVVMNWAAIDPRAAAQWVEAVPGETTTTFPVLADIWLRHEEDEASRWIASLPPSPARDEAVDVLLKRLIREDPEASWSWALSLQNEKQRGDRLTDAMREWWKKDAPAAQAALEAAGITLEQLRLSDLASP